MTKIENKGIPEAVDKLVERARAPLVALLEDIYDRLEDYVDVNDGSDGPTPNFAMSIRTSIDIALGRQP